MTKRYSVAEVAPTVELRNARLATSTSTPQHWVLYPIR